MTEDLPEIFRRLRKALGKCEGRLVARIDRDSRYELWSVKEMTIAGRRRKDLYDMPVYVDKDMQSVFTPERQIREALARGFAMYQERGWA